MQGNHLHREEKVKITIVYNRYSLEIVDPNIRNVLKTESTNEVNQ